jgi:hypothetical protein
MSAKRRLFIEFGLNIAVSFLFPLYWIYIYHKSRQFAKKNFFTNKPKELYNQEENELRQLEIE